MNATTHRVLGAIITIVVATTMLFLIAVDAQAHDGGMRYCGTSPSGTYQVRAGDATSCPFALNTAHRLKQIQTARGGIPFGSNLTLRVYSRVTHRSYRMHCSVSVPPVARISCWGGSGRWHNSAQVYIGPRA